MSMQIQMWKKELDQGKAISLEVTSNALKPALTRGDSVSIRWVPYPQIVVGDIVFCAVDGKAGLHKISGVRHMYGVRTFEVGNEGEVAKSVPEKGVIGKVMSSKRRGQKGSAVPGESLFSRLKSLLFKPS